MNRIKIQELKVQILEATIEGLFMFKYSLQQGEFHHKSRFRMGFSPNMTFKCENGEVFGCQLRHLKLHEYQDASSLLEVLNEHLHDNHEEYPKWCKATLSEDEEYFIIN